MKIFDPMQQRERWLSRALCRRYAAVVFSTLSEPSLETQLENNRTIYWAFGCLHNGESEILGAWNLDAESATMTAVFGDLYRRGVEFLRFGLGSLGDVEAAFLATFRMSAAYPSLEQTMAALIAKVKPFHRPAMATLLRAAIGDPHDASAAVSSVAISSEDLRKKYPGILVQWREAVAGFQPLFVLPEPYRQLVRSVDRTAIDIQGCLMKAIYRHGPFVDSGDAFDFVVDRLVRADLRLVRDAEGEEMARQAVHSKFGRFAAVPSGAVGTPTLA